MLQAAVCDGCTLDAFTLDEDCLGPAEVDVSLTLEQHRDHCLIPAPTCARPPEVSRPTGASCQPDCARRPDYCRVRCGSTRQLGIADRSAPASRPVPDTLCPVSPTRWCRPFQRKIRGEA